MHGFLPIFFLMVVLKIPVFGAIWLIWWASKEEPLADDLYDEDTGPRRWHPEPKRPRGPRRGGPHGAPGAKGIPDCPPGGRPRITTRPPAPVRAGTSNARGQTRPAHEQS